VAPDAVFIGVPVFQAGAFVAETIESLLAQTHRAFRLVLSVDGADEESEHICARYLADPRVEMVVQPERLGWVRNTAFLHARAIEERATFACIQPHDDLAHPDYLSSLLNVAARHPRASVVYSDIECFGTVRGLIRQLSCMSESPLARMMDLLSSHFNAVAYRGLTRVSALKTVPAINENACGNFAVDTLWMTRLGRAGDLVRVPRPLYRKRYHASNTHAKWFTWPPEKKIEAWSLHCLDMLKEALSVTRDAVEQRRLLEMAGIRLLARGHQICPYRQTIHSLAKERRQELLTDFLAQGHGLARMARSIDPKRPSGLLSCR
jgi:glycosyltransferase involved in cell wall biosynthesis